MLKFKILQFFKPNHEDEYRYLFDTKSKKYLKINIDPKNNSRTYDWVDTKQESSTLEKIKYFDNLGTLGEWLYIQLMNFSLKKKFIIKRDVYAKSKSAAENENEIGKMFKTLADMDNMKMGGIK